MRHLKLFPWLLLALACEGRYVLGDSHQKGGEGGSALGQSGSGSGRSNESGEGGSLSAQSGSASGGSMAAGSGGGGEGGSIAGDAGSGGDGGGENPAARTRWAVVQTFPASSSTQTLLHVVDLHDPEAAPVQIEGQHGNYISFSGDGRWFEYRSFRSASETDHYLVNLSGARPSERQLLLTSDSYAPCQWSPDSSKLACLKVGATAIELVYFEMSPSGFGPERSLGSLPPRSDGPSPGTQHELLFVDDATLVVSFGPNDFARVEWLDGEPSAPQPLAIGGGFITHRAADGVRVAVRRVDPNYPLGEVLVDLKQGKSELYDEKISLSSTFQIGLSQELPAAEETGFGTFSFYAIDGIHVTRVAQAPLQGLTDKARIVGPDTVVLTKGDDLIFTAVGPLGIAQHTVPGEHPGVDEFQLDSSQSWLYFETVERDAQHAPIPATGRHWLSRLEQGVPGEPQLIAEGFYVGVSGEPLFAPDGQRLVLPGIDSKSEEPVPFRLIELGDPHHVVSKNIDVPFIGAQQQWSPDGTFLSFIGMNPHTKSRQHVIVDVLDLERPPRLLFECNSNPAPLPGCPNFIQFQL